MDKEYIINNLKKKLLKIKPYKVILFGSILKDNFSEDSDVDIVVILNKKGLSKNYKEIINNKRMISQEISDLRKKIPIDLLVFTIDEWEYIKKSGNYFFKEIVEEGVTLI